MSNWETYSLGDISKNISRKFDFNTYPNVVFINTGDVLNNKFLHSEVSEYKDLPGQAKKAIKKGDILYSEIRPGNGRYLFVNDELSNYVVSTKFMVIEPNVDIVLPEFLFLLLISNETTEYFKMIAESRSGTFPQITFDSVSNFTLNIPDKETQKEILSIINPLDEKIELNTQINQTLEQIAQAIFKSWFVDFAPVRAKAAALESGKTQAEAELAAMQAISGKTAEELAQMPSESYAELAEIAKAFPSEFGEDGVPMGWEQATLSEICEMQNGYAFKSSDWTESGTPVIKIGSVKPMIVEVEGNGFVSDEYQKLKPDFLLTNGDILVGLTGYVGEVGRIPQGKVAMLNQRVAKFIPKAIEENCNFYNYVYCLARQPQFKEFAEINAKGSAQANISTKELLKFPIIKADNKLHILFENKIRPILEKILANSQSSEDLAKVRDLLLPRLLSGEM